MKNSLISNLYLSDKYKTNGVNTVWSWILSDMTGDIHMRNVAYWMRKQLAMKDKFFSIANLFFQIFWSSFANSTLYKVFFWFLKQFQISKQELSLPLRTIILSILYLQKILWTSSMTAKHLFIGKGLFICNRCLSCNIQKKILLQI